MVRKSKSSKENIYKKPIIFVIIVFLVTAVMYIVYDAHRQATGECIEYKGLSKKHCMGEFLGLRIGAAESKAKKAGLYPLVVSIDGKPQTTAQSKIMFPVFFMVEHGVVVSGGFDESYDKSVDALLRQQRSKFVRNLNDILVDNIDSGIYGGMWIGDGEVTHVGIVGAGGEFDAASKKVRELAIEHGTTNLSIDSVRNTWKVLLDTNGAINSLNQKYIDYKHGVWPIQMGIKTDENKVQVDIPPEEHMTDAHRKVISIMDEKYQGIVFYETYTSLAVEQ